MTSTERNLRTLADADAAGVADTATILLRNRVIVERGGRLVMTDSVTIGELRAAVATPRV